MRYANGDPLNNKILYVQCDHIMLATISLYEIAQSFSDLGGEMIAFDEIHKYPNWSMELKSIADTFPTLKILASGSSALAIHKGSHDLSRRALVYRMAGISFREFLEMKLGITLAHYSLKEIIENHVAIAADIIKKLPTPEKILALFQAYLQVGYYPYHVEFASKAEFYMTLEQNIHTTIESDLVAIHPELTGNSIKKIKQLISYIATQVPFTPSWTKIKDIIDVKDNRTLRTYFKYLEDAGLIRTLLSATQKLSAIEQVEKIYLGNTCELYTIGGLTPQTGTIRETFFISMLQPNHSVGLPSQGDFKIDNHYVIEVGGRNKKNEQIKNIKNSYLALDNVEQGIDKKIPLWLFGFLY